MFFLGGGAQSAGGKQTASGVLTKKTYVRQEKRACETNK